MFLSFREVMQLSLQCDGDIWCFCQASQGQLGLKAHIAKGILSGWTCSAHTSDPWNECAAELHHPDQQREPEMTNSDQQRATQASFLCCSLKTVKAIKCSLNSPEISWWVKAWEISQGAQNKGSFSFLSNHPSLTSTGNMDQNKQNLWDVFFMNTARTSV